jgi:hypothetical protein
MTCKWLTRSGAGAGGGRGSGGLAVPAQGKFSSLGGRWGWVGPAGWDGGRGRGVK